MGQVIYLDQRRSERSRSGVVGQPLFFFDVSCPLSYLTAERIERKLGEVQWVPVDGGSLRARAASRDAGTAAPEVALDAGRADPEFLGLRSRADSCARALRLPLVWPDRFPGAARCAQRAAAFACEIGAGAAFALAASRLAFCGGFDLDDPEVLAEAAAAAGLGLPEVLGAAGDPTRDGMMEGTALRLLAQGADRLPVLHVGRTLFCGEHRIAEAAASIRRRPRLNSPAQVPNAG
jgi:2-hydroxychromene-2-carboxylate isomerase